MLNAPDVGSVESTAGGERFLREALGFCGDIELSHRIVGGGGRCCSDEFGSDVRERGGTADVLMRIGSRRGRRADRVGVRGCKETFRFAGWKVGR